MNCEAVIRDLPLYLYGELPGEHEESVEDHLHSCNACRAALERQRRTAQLIRQREAAVPAGLLAECRHDLMRMVYRNEGTGQPRPRRSWRVLEQALGALTVPLSRLRFPLGAMTLLAIGYFSARILSVAPGSSISSGGVHVSSLSPEEVISRVRSVQPDTAGRVQIALDETRRRVVSGPLDDGRIRSLLLAAARDENNPSVRVESVDVLKEDPASADVRGVLLYALGHDPNPGVRLKALEGLKPSAGDAEVRKILTEVLLKDENPGVRIQVIDLLVAHRDDSMVGMLQGLVQRERNSYVRLRCEKALKEMNASVGTF